jgi:hypothetical protein
MSQDRPETTELPAQLRAYNYADFDTSAVLTCEGGRFADVPWIRHASDLIETVHAAAAEIERLRAQMERMIVEVSRWSIAASEEMEAIYRGKQS